MTGPTKNLQEWRNRHGKVTPPDWQIFMLELIDALGDMRDLSSKEHVNTPGSDKFRFNGMFSPSVVTAIAVVSLKTFLPQNPLSLATVHASYCSRD